MGGKGMFENHYAGLSYKTTDALENTTKLPPLPGGEGRSEGNRKLKSVRRLGIFKTLLVEGLT